VCAKINGFLGLGLLPEDSRASAIRLLNFGPRRRRKKKRREIAIGNKSHEASHFAVAFMCEIKKNLSEIEARRERENIYNNLRLVEGGEGQIVKQNL
jgi:hypothetical protein